MLHRKSNKQKLYLIFHYSLLFLHIRTRFSTTKISLIFKLIPDHRFFTIPLLLKIHSPSHLQFFKQHDPEKQMMMMMILEVKVSGSFTSLTQIKHKHSFVYESIIDLKKENFQSSKHKTESFTLILTITNQLIKELL